MYKKAISFYKTSWPGLILVVIFSFTFIFGFLKATFPEAFYEKASGKIDTAIIGIGYYQNNHTVELKLGTGNLVLHQNYPLWWYAPHPKAADLKSGKQVSVLIKKSTGGFFGIKAGGKVIQPAWFDILTDYFNSRSILMVMIACFLLISIYHFGEVIKNVYLWMPYALGILALTVFWGYLNLIIFVIVALVVLKYILKKRKAQQLNEQPVVE
ncbi:hypothetical protein SAMN05421820_113114 [Pedobacter steynii]|uniref:Uncharacterized protein n=1 Tax=Pedobacter steynii TaxID=430522 RepID=A0A1H0ICV3_9SPHI|nr:hypothetical protein [Pedobacter steynii]NQX42864.1 hypothetical protein [Pedobacter steynii]SDO29195.1 hypothetical protein SAMN05421820_113114 [Pedobacter steynii]